MAVVNFFKLFVLFTFLSSVSPRPEKNVQKTKFSLPICSRIECPNFDVIQTSKDFEIRRYNSMVLMSTSPMEDNSLVRPTKYGFRSIIGYTQGLNKYGRRMKMTSPVITQVFPSGPVSPSSFVVSFYVPKANQADVPPTEELKLQNLGTKYAAVRQFGGFVADVDVGKEAAALVASLAGSTWSSAIKNTSVYTVAQYNSPLELISDRVNEIWLLFDVKKEE